MKSYLPREAVKFQQTLKGTIGSSNSSGYLKIPQNLPNARYVNIKVYDTTKADMISFGLIDGVDTLVQDTVSAFKEATKSSTDAEGKEKSIISKITSGVKSF